MCRTMICNLCLKPLCAAGERTGTASSSSSSSSRGSASGGACVFITVCSHVFCGPCAKASFTAQAEDALAGCDDAADDVAAGTPSTAAAGIRSRKAIVLCPVCDTPLTIPDGARDQGTVFQSLCPVLRKDAADAVGAGDGDTVSVCDDRDIVPLVMQHLCGFDPAALMFMAQKASEFWLYQQRFREEQLSLSLAQEAGKAKDEAQAALAKAAEMQVALQAEQRKTALVMEECEEQRTKAEQLQEKIVELTRQKRKLTELYNALKARHQELVSKVGLAAPQQQQQAQQPPPQPPQPHPELRVCSSRAGLLASAAAAKTGGTAAVTVCPQKCLFPSTPAAAAKLTQQAPAAQPPSMLSCKRPLGPSSFFSPGSRTTSVVLNVTPQRVLQARASVVPQVHHTKTPQQPLRPQQQCILPQQPLHKGGGARPPSEKRPSLASKWDILSSCFDSQL